MDANSSTESSSTSKFLYTLIGILICLVVYLIRSLTSAGVNTAKTNAKSQDSKGLDKYIQPLKEMKSMAKGSSDDKKRKSKSKKKDKRKDRDRDNEKSRKPTSRPEPESDSDSEPERMPRREPDPPTKLKGILKNSYKAEEPDSSKTSKTVSAPGRTEHKPRSFSFFDVRFAAM